MKPGKTYTLITGGSMGIGLELARLFAADGHNLILVARTEADLEKVKAELGQQVEVITISKDLFDPDAAYELYEEVQELGLQVNILVNDAGQGQYGLFKDNDIQRELDIVQLNISSLLVLTKLFLPDMIARGDGRILNLSSIASKTPGPWQAVYHGTKAFVQSFTEALRSELKDDGIVVTALLPGATNTDFFNKAGMQDSKVVQDPDKLGDPVKVAKDGYDALMSDDDKVVSGFKNKMMVGMSNITPDEMAADNMKKQQEPVNQKK